MSALPSVIRITLLASLVLGGCSEKKKAGSGVRYNPEEQRSVLVTTKHDEALVRSAIAGIKLHDEYTASNFEAKQEAYFAQMTPQMRKMARANLPNRVMQIVQAQASNIVKPDFASHQLDKVPAEDAARVQVRIESDNQFQANGRTREPRRMIYVVNMLVYDLDTIQFESIATKPAGETYSPR